MQVKQSWMTNLSWFTFTLIANPLIAAILLIMILNSFITLQTFASVHAGVLPSAEGHIQCCHTVLQVELSEEAKMTWQLEQLHR